MRSSSKALIATQFLSSAIIVALVSHAGAYGRSFFGASPTVTALLLLSSAHMFISFFILLTSFHTHKIYDTPLICFHGLLFFALLLGTGVATIVESIKFDSVPQRETTAAGAVAVFSAFATITACGFSYNIYENWKNF